MEQALKSAGFRGVEQEAGVIYARLPGGEEAFRADPRPDGGWQLSLCWAVGASAEQRAGWNKAQPKLLMDLFEGETRVSYVIAPGPDEALNSLFVEWQVLAEAAIAQMILWRRVQRAPGEGM